MIQFLRRYRLHILLVEDRLKERADLVRFLKRPFCYPNAVITDVPDRVQAKAAIDAALETREPFDCAILDLKIPDRVGEAEYASADVANHFVNRHPLAKHNPSSIWVVHWTAWPDDPEITKFREFLSERGVAHRVVSKNSSRAPEEITEFLDRALIEKALGKLLDDPFFSEEMGENAWAVTIRSPRRRRPPMNLLGMAALLVAHWKDLSEYRRGQALRTLAGSELAIVDHGETADFKHKEAQRAAKVWLEEADRANPLP